jgi:hypothetical protein
LDDVAAALLTPPGGPHLWAVVTCTGCHGKTWWRLKLEPYKLAYYLAKEYKATSLTKENAVMGQLDNLGADADRAALMATASSSPATKYFLVNLDGMVSVLYGMAKCFELIQTGCYYALKGDYSHVHPDAPASPLDLQVLPRGSQDQDQAWTFEAVEIHVPFLVDAIQELRAHPERMLVAPLDEARGAPTTVVWRALPVHPKTMVLFLRGVPAREEALFQAFTWYQWLPIGSQECLAPLLKQVHVGHHHGGCG